MKHIIAGNLKEKEGKYILNLFDNNFHFEDKDKEKILKIAHDQMVNFFKFNDVATAFVFERLNHKKSVFMYDFEEGQEEWFECSLKDYYKTHSFYQAAKEMNEWPSFKSKNFFNYKFGQKIIKRDSKNLKKLLKNISQDKLIKRITFCNNEYKKALKNYTLKNK